MATYDPEITTLRDLVEQYLCQYDIGDGALDRSSVEHLYKMDDEIAKRSRRTLIRVRGDDGRWRITQEHGSAPRLYALVNGDTV